MMASPRQRRTMENGHWVCSKQWKKSFLCLLLGTVFVLASSAVLCLPPDSYSREIPKMRMQAAAIWFKEQKENVERMQGPTPVA